MKIYSKFLKLNAAFGAVALVLSIGAASMQRTWAQGATNAAAADGAVRYESAPGASSCEISGTSTMHAWTMKTVQLVGHIEADANFPESALGGGAKAKPEVRIRVPLKTLKSDKDAMDKRMQEHMEVTKYPNVEFRLLELKPKSPAGTKGPLQFDAVGTLAIYGKSLTNTMPVTIEKKDGKMVVTGSTPLKMSDYGIPKLTFLALASVGDELKITFSWVIAPKAKPAQ
jgi:polyisoprenoid-binding protein YceI